MGYSEGLARFGDLGLGVEPYTARIVSISTKYLGSDAGDQATANFIKTLHRRDLYLATACAQESLGMAEYQVGAEPQKQAGFAWKALEAHYKGFVRDLARFFFRRSFIAEDLADDLLADLYFPDRTGASRIVSYDGRSSLSTWLRVVISNRAINARRSTRTQDVEIDTEIPDSTAVSKIEASVRRRRYESPFLDSLRIACGQLTPRERLVLLWRYQDGLQLGHIAKLLGIHQSNVTRQLDRMTAKLRDQVVATLSAKHRLSLQAIQECLRDIADDPVQSVGILEFLQKTGGTESSLLSKCQCAAHGDSAPEKPASSCLL